MTPELEYWQVGDVMLYTANRPFVVDEVWYIPVGFTRPMVEIVEQVDCTPAWARMRCNKPPTDAELDVYVRTGDIDMHPYDPSPPPL